MMKPMRTFGREQEPAGHSRRALSLVQSLRHAASLALFFLLCGGSPSAAHPISLTSVFVNVEDERVTAELNMLVEDLILYYWMESDDEFRFPADDLKEQAREHQKFLLRYLHLRDRDGNRLSGEIVDIDFSELDDEGVHIDDLMAYSIRYHFEFPLEERPEFLTVSQNFGGDEPAVPAEMGVRFFHHGVHMESVMLSHGTAHTVRLDWDAGWERARDDLDQARERLKQRREDALGITSYSAVYSYVYITDTEIRHEILIPLLTLETWLPLERADPDVMTVEEQQAAGEAVSSFLAEHNRVEIDGSPVSPELDRLDFFGPEFRDFARESPERDVSVHNARVGVILSFPTEETAESLKFEWNYFDERLPVFKPTVYVFEDETRENTLHPRRTAFEWENDRDREFPQFAGIEKPAPPPKIQLPLFSLTGGGAAVILALAGLRAGPVRRRLACAIVAGGLAIGALATLPYARAEIPHPFQSHPEIDNEQASLLFEKLHRNIYRAFQYRDEERIYDALNQSVAGPLLEDLYLQIRRNLTVEEQGGAVSRIDEIEILDGARQLHVNSSPAYPSFAYQCTWTVTGTIEHWGHIHTRTNSYEALFIIKGFPEGWKITDFEPLQEERIDRRIRLRQ